MPRRDFDSDLEPRPRRRRTRRRSGPHLGLVLGIVGGALFLVAATIVVGVLAWKGKFGAVTGPVDARVENDLDRLAGTWESTFRDPTGRVTMHKVKVIDGNTETATWYRPDGSVFRVNRVQFELKQRGANKIFRYFNGWVMEGPGAGQPFPSGEYEYSLDGDVWTEFLTDGGVIVWTRRRP